MKETIFVPKKINIGFQKRDDTYTKKLAYVIYFDEKEKLRKENSWNSWRDKTIDNEIYDNIPMTGFVLNKKVGDYGGWKSRQAYIRVYDPRDFEFEITVANLLYILENTSSIKGKGLEGEFVYGWDGADLVLLPTGSADYKEIEKYNKAVHKAETIKAKDLIVGATYKAKNGKEYVYMGRFDKWTEYRDEAIPVENRGKHHFFLRKNADSIVIKSIGGRFIETVTTDMSDNYAELYNRLEHNRMFSPIDNSRDEYVPYTFEEFETAAKRNKWSSYFYDNRGTRYAIEGNATGDLYQCASVTRYYLRGHRAPFMTLKEIHDKYKPCKRTVYLSNGKIYKEHKL